MAVVAVDCVGVTALLQLLPLPVLLAFKLLLLIVKHRDKAPPPLLLLRRRAMTPELLLFRSRGMTPTEQTQVSIMGKVVQPTIIAAAGTAAAVAAYHGLLAQVGLANSKLKTCPLPTQPWPACSNLM